MRYFIVPCCLLLGGLLALPVQLPERTGKSVAGFTGDELKKLLEKARAENDVPALTAGVFRPGTRPLLSVVGVRKRGTDNRADLNDRWHIGSNTKPLTALLVALLIELGLLDWNTPLEEIFPECAEKWGADVKKITTAQLLTHTSGLPPTGPLVGFLIFGSRKTPVEDREQIVRSLHRLKLTARPGEKYEYSNLGYVVLGAIVDRRGKASWEKQLEERIFRPLGIKSWSLGPPGKKEADVTPWPHQAGGKPLSADDVLDNPPVMNSAGRVCLSLGDYGRFLEETLKLSRGQKGLLGPRTAQKLFSNPYPASPHSLSGWVGIPRERGAKGLILAHDGSNTFNYCTAMLVPDQNLAFCVLTNQGAPRTAPA